ncbi:MAG: hypothetical protein L3J28_03470 [Candidatus Polarisedimenticolaceae bacterium]|nr:hypothetical protein [Candidatus Polarisedimenticolaceae bacterium]
MRHISTLILVALMAFFTLSMVQAGEQVKVTVESLHKDMTELKGKMVQLQGKIIKVNNGIMGRNFLHLQDGTGTSAAGNNDLTVTSNETANVGDEVTILGVVVLDHDFGSGYRYPLMVEEAVITKKK